MPLKLEMNKKFIKVVILLRGRSRYSLHSIMTNSGFGSLTIVNSDCKIIIPQDYITRNGSVYQKIQSIIDKKEYDRLLDYNITVIR
jgi:hypothetical protein